MSMNREHRLDARKMGEQQLCTKEGKIKEFLVILRARESRKCQQIITTEKEGSILQKRVQQANLKKQRKHEEASETRTWGECKSTTGRAQLLGSLIPQAPEKVKSPAHTPAQELWGRREREPRFGGGGKGSQWRLFSEITTQMVTLKDHVF